MSDRNIDKQSNGDDGLSSSQSQNNHFRWHSEDNSRDDMQLDSSNANNQGDYAPPLEISVTNSDIHIQKKLDRLNIRAKIYLILFFISFFCGLYLGLLSKFRMRHGLYNYDPEFTVEICAFITIFVLGMLYCYAKSKKSSVYKKDIVEPILVKHLNYNPDASKFFKKHAPVRKMLKSMDLFSFMRIDYLDCVLGECNNTKFAFIDVGITHNEGIITHFFKGQIVYMLASKIVPNEYRSGSMVRDLGVLSGLSSVFCDAFSMVNSAKAPTNDETSAVSYNQNINSFDDVCSNDSNHPYAKSSFGFDGSSNASDKSSTSAEHISIDEARKELSQWGECKIFCSEKEIIICLKNEKDPFKIKFEDTTKDIKLIKKRIIDDTNWVKQIVSTFKKTGLV